MTLTPRYRKNLRAMREFRAKPPTVGRYLRAAWRLHFLLVALSGLGVGFFIAAGWPIAAALLAGLAMGAVLRDIGWFRRFAAYWPLSDAITDWQRVDELLDEPPPAGPIR